MSTLAQRITDLATAIHNKFNANAPRLVPAGGGAGQVLSKTSAADYTAGWANCDGSPAYVSGRWYLPQNNTATLSGAATGAGTIRFMPLHIKRAVTISQLGVLITTVAASGKVRLGIYASNANGGPTGTPLGVVSDLSTTTATTVSGALAANITLTPGLYWTAVQADNATSACLSIDRSTGEAARLVGDTTLANVLQVSTTGFTGYQITGTYAAGMTDMTAGGYAVNSGSPAALIAFKVA